jgi:hypothetical protein
MIEIIFYKNGQTFRFVKKWTVERAERVLFRMGVEYNIIFKRDAGKTTN